MTELSPTTQPEPQGPTDAEMQDLALHCVKGNKSVEWVIQEALARWGRPAIEPVPVKPAVEEAAKHAVESCLSQREEVLAAFISKYGFHPEDAIQVEQRQEDGTSSWRIERRSAIEPVPVDERLPGPEHCDDQGRCWMCGKVDGDWRLISIDNPGVPQLKYAFSHWLPHWALPVPQGEG